MMLVGCIAVAALIAVAVIVKQFRTDALTWDMGSTYILVVGIAFHMGLGLSKLTGSDEYRVDSSGVRQLVNPGWISSVVPSHQVVVLVAAAVVGWLALAKRRSVVIPLPASLWTSFIVIALAVDYLRYGSLPSGEPLLMLVSLIAACAAVRSRAGVITGAATFVLGMCILGALIAVVNSAAAIQTCTVKCSIGGIIFSGPTSHGNSLGLILACGLPFVWMAFRGQARVWLVIYVAANLALSGSRTAMLAGAAGLVVLVVTNPSIQGRIVSGRNQWFAIGSATCLAVTSLLVPRLITDPNFATGRGRLWELAFSRIEGTPLFGEGSTAWYREFTAGSFGSASAYSTHNQWVEATLFLGMVGVVLFGAIVFAFMMPRSANSRFLIAPVLAVIFSLGVTERPIALALVDLISWVLFALIMISVGDSPLQGKASPYLQAVPGIHTVGQIPSESKKRLSMRGRNVIA
ncbi:O-antigen ligase family protein [Rhodococcus sp. IEGM 1305]|uniref:O-antigen ligase family protein n=1 Tax=Rhodococcus sp. IEGM 1305 TaxID=3047092 RepID=UPI0024B86C93|nr:O-antigen ligase family protein [Rhodococcus sp. IEGM 1305]MDI9948781.1 O-antigen ligase family protein [Rhodococcus sp. IEGM 1305]